MAGDEVPSTCSCKIGRQIDRYGFDNLNADLVRLHRDEGASLRDLADHVNQRILAAALAAANADITNILYGAVSDDDALTTLYQALASDDIPPERAARVRTRLTQLGTDVETIEADWVTHPTVRTHLRDCLNVDTHRTPSLSLPDARDTIEWSRTRCMNIIEETFTRLRNTDLVSTGPLDVAVTIQVTCTVCGETYRPSQLLTNRECACTATDNTPDKTQ